MTGMVEGIIWESRVAIHVSWDHTRGGRCLDLRGELGRAFSRLKEDGMSVSCTLGEHRFLNLQHLPWFHLCWSSSLVAGHSRIPGCATSPRKDVKEQTAGTADVRFVLAHPSFA